MHVHKRHLGGGGEPEGPQAPSLFVIKSLLLCKCINFSFTNLRPL